jgi:CBS domain-containing protein
LSPRAACRLETFGFTDVYDYVPGKVDWLAHNLEVEGERADAPTVAGVMRDDVVRCAPTDRVADVRESIERSPYPFGLVTSEDGTVLGRVPASGLDPSSVGPVWDVAEPGPKTFRPHHSFENVAGHLAEKKLRWAIVTTPEGRLLGVASRDDLERAG